MDNKNTNKHEDIDAILNGILKMVSLREQFEKRLHELGITQTAAQKILGIERRTLNGILDGTQKRVNFIYLNKLAVFLNQPTEQIIETHVSLIEKNFENQTTPANKKRFIRENFDLAVLRKAGFIDSVNDFEKIENKIVSFFGYSSIFEYEKRTFNTAFSAGVVKPKTNTARDFWLTAAKNFTVRLDNPYHFDRQELIKFFPQIRWLSTNVELGLVNVIKALFKIGVTVIFQPTLSSLHLRGATFSVNNKPCIALTDYKGFYPTLWHCLIHELYHVLFDWDEINISYHISDDTDELLTIDENEMQADDFARRYLFSDEKMEEVRPYIFRSDKYINDVAKDNNIHPSIIYIYNAYDNGKTDRMVWPRTRRHMPDIKKSVYRLENPWDNSKPIDEIVKKRKLEIYN